MSLLQVRHLAKSFGGVRAVDDVSFDLPAGQLLALLGPNGAGKSTCFNMVNGQIKPDAGAILLDGRDIAGMAPREIWRMGVGRTFQIAATFHSMTVIENVQMALISHERKLLGLWHPVRTHHRDEAMALLAQVGMADQAERACSVLSYGDVKRVELAMAMANKPRLLLMDEPTAGMASKERHALVALTKQLVVEQQLAVLFTEHSMDVVFGHADRIVVMAQGQVIAQGTPDEVRDDPAARAAYLGESTSIDTP